MKFRYLFPFCIAVIGAVCLSAAPAGSNRALYWVITRNCMLRVDGATNINRFSCRISKYAGADTVSAIPGPDGSYSMRGQVSLRIADFDCGNAAMTADLRKTLKGGEYPALLIRFKSLSAIPSGGQSRVTGVVDIVLSGVVRRFDIDYTVARTPDDGIILTGTRGVDFSDFNLKPPRKLGGMIKTEDELAIGFSLNMRKVGTPE
jgi:hypothetical protein